MMCAPPVLVAAMTEPSYAQLVLQAADTLERLQQDSVTCCVSYTPEKLRLIVKMWGQA